MHRRGKIFLLFYRRPRNKKWRYLLACVSAHTSDVKIINRHPALASCSSMIFSENRCTLFGIMPRAHPDWIEWRCALDSLVLRMSLSENRFPLFRDMR
jgi:hypothetical protein